MILNDDNFYTCPECDSENLSVSMRCSVNPNTNDVEVDWESDVGDSDKWSCDNCGHCGFLPNTEDIDADDEKDDNTDELMTCGLCGKQEPEHDAIPRGWIPDYLDGEEHKHDPVCVECCATRITVDDNGDSILITTTH